MKKIRQHAVGMILVSMIFGLLILVGCSKKELGSAPAPTPQGSQATDQMPHSAATTAAPAEKPATAPGTTKAAPKDVVLLKASLGTVHFQHKIHSETRKIACETCHHASRPEKPETAPQEACSTCHTLTAAPPMKTKLQAAFHNPTASAGTCIDCHKAQNAQGKSAPLKCLECHKKVGA